MARKKQPTATAVPKIINGGSDILPAADLTPNPDNVNEGDLGAVMESIRIHGFYGRLHIERGTNRILMGNTRFAAGSELGMMEFPVEYFDVSEDEAARLALVDNRTSRLGVDNPKKLADELRRLAETELGLLGTGFDGNELDELLKDLGERAGSGGGSVEGGEDDVPNDAPTRTKPREIWLLGPHRLLVGDAFDDYDRNLLLKGAEVNLVFADPPYGMDLNTDNTHYGKLEGVKSKTYKKVHGDDRPFDPRPLLGAFDGVKEQLWWGGDYFYDKLPAGGSWIVWDKRTEASDGILGNHFEVCWSRAHHKREMKRLQWAGVTAHDKDEKRTHPTQKPVALYEDLIGAFTAEGDIIVDPFLGSGTTIIAAHKTGRVVYGCEILPELADIILSRFEKATSVAPRREVE